MKRYRKTVTFISVFLFCVATAAAVFAQTAAKADGSVVLGEKTAVAIPLVVLFVGGAGAFFSLRSDVRSNREALVAHTTDVANHHSMEGLANTFLPKTEANLQFQSLEHKLDGVLASSDTLKRIEERLNKLP
jgi:hypothetical protein